MGHKYYVTLWNAAQHRSNPRFVLDGHEGMHLSIA